MWSKRLECFTTDIPFAPIFSTQNGGVKNIRFQDNRVIEHRGPALLHKALKHEFARTLKRGGGRIPSSLLSERTFVTP